MLDSGQGVIELRNVSKTFPGTVALQGIDIEIRPGEVHALVGQNGSGKSTLIKILAGFHRPDPGAEASIGGQPYQLGDAASAHEAGLRFVHQDLGLVPTLDCVDNLALGIGYVTDRAGRIKWRAQRAAARKILASSFGPDYDLRRPVSRLTPFEKSALAIMRAMQNVEETRILMLVLDEPTATMPRPNVDRLFELIRRITSLGTAVLLVSHHLDEVFAIADRVTVLRDGRRVATREIAGLAPEGLIQLMTGGAIEQVAHRAETAAVRGRVVLSVSDLGGRSLRGLNMEVRAGEVLGIAGLNGSGREEVCELIFGARLGEGTVTVGESVLPGGRPDLAIAAGVALVPANRHAQGLILSQSVRENLTLVDVKAFWRHFHLSRTKEISSVRDWVKKIRIKTASTETAVELLSGGNQQKVVIGKWLRVKPAVLLLDEPTQGVDVGSQAEIHRLIRVAADEGAGVVICSTDETELGQVCDRVLVLCNGVVAGVLTGSEISAHRLEQLSLQASTSVAARS